LIRKGAALASHTDTTQSGAPAVGRRPFSSATGHVISREARLVGGILARSDVVGRHLPELVRYPERLAREDFYTLAYPLMYLSRRMEDRLLELFKKGYVKGTVTDSWGNEAAAVGMTMPLRPGLDVVSIWHRDLLGHLLLGSAPYDLFCQYMANAESPTHAREGNCHHGDASRRRFPMMSHLGKMLSLVVGGTWAARRRGEHAFGLAVLGDGASSTGEFHEAVNLASVQKSPVIFLVENNHYSFSTPTSKQYNCRHLSDRARGYGILGYTIDGLDAWEVYTTICDVMDAMEATKLPVIVECMTLRLNGHAAYDKNEYVPAEQQRRWREQDPVPAARRQLIETCGMAESVAASIEEAVEEEINEALNRAMAVGRPDPSRNGAAVFAPARPPKVKPYKSPAVKNGEAVGRALDYLLENNPNAFLMGLDVGRYGSAFKTCKGLFDRHGPERVIDMPVCESAQVGFALGASQIGLRPIMEFQFADFSTEVGSQLGMNSSTWYYRAGMPAPMLFRLPCGGGVTMGAFHSGEFEGLWSRFPGLKLLYPATAQETFEALTAGFYDPNPCIVFEHKQLYWSRSGEIDFDGDLEAVWRPRRYSEGADLTVAAFGAMVHECLAAAQRTPHSIEIWNPFVLQPLDIGPILESVAKTGRLLVVQESGETQGLGDRIVSLVCREAFAALKAPPRLIAAPNMPIPFAPELEAAHRPGAQRIEAAINTMLAEN